MRQGLKGNSDPFPSPWEYFEIPKYLNAYLRPTNPTLPLALEKVLYPDAWIQANMQYRHLASAEAHAAAKFFVIADFIGMKYERFHPTFIMKPVPDAVLRYLKPPFNQMKRLGYEDQKQFRAGLPDELKREVYIDE
jgi:hypothetical protein